MIAAVYVVIRNIMVGNGLFGTRFSGQKMVIINSLVCGITITTITTTLNAANDGLKQMGAAAGIALTALITFASGALLAFI
ncbi:MAG: DUF6773 family protein [Bacillota bacterium]|nr:DUF6773 family protein [Bacillota bacterium]